MSCGFAPGERRLRNNSAAPFPVRQADVSGGFRSASVRAPLCITARIRKRCGLLIQVNEFPHDVSPTRNPNAIILSSEQEKEFVLWLYRSIYG